ncbi:MAG: hypothetical protein DDG59_06560 [Anaerolineae bacterium]|jgi:thiol-disulfide isomerase/thioredoxin|nr:MAG: hypothetical protein DDG59_06560 [Anaerolineae bacterium]
MKKLTLCLLLFCLGISFGCANQPQQVSEGTQPNGPMPTGSTPINSTIATGQPSSYLLEEQESANSDHAVTEPYPSTTDGFDQEPLSPTLLETPTAHVDVVMRATDPNRFVLASGKIQLVEFFAFWCPTCKSLAPVLRNLEHRYSERIQFIYLDIDDPRTNPYKQALGYLYQPHLFLIDGEGKIIQQWVGYVTEEELDAVIRTVQ